jgi:hypothetical protein
LFSSSSSSSSWYFSLVKLKYHSISHCHQLKISQSLDVFSTSD